MAKGEFFRPEDGGQAIDVTGWSYENYEELDNRQRSAVNNLIQEVFEEDPPEIKLPSVMSKDWDTLTLVMEVPLGPQPRCNPEWRFSLRDVVLSSLSAADDSHCEPLSTEEKAAAALALANELRSLAEDIAAQYPQRAN